MSARSELPQVARLEASHAQAPLFRALPRSGARPNGTVVQEVEGRKLTWQLFERLDDDDQSVLLAVIYACGQKRLAISDSAASAADSQLRSTLDPTSSLGSMPTAKGLTTLGFVARVLGWSGATAYDRIFSSLRRLAAVSVIVQTHRRGTAWSSHLLAFRLDSLEPSGPEQKTFEAREKSRGARWQLTLLLNPALTAAALGMKGARWTVCRLDERRQLHSSVARIAHAWLSWWLRPGTTRPVSLDNLAAHVWIEPAASSQAQRDRRKALNRALDELAGIGWGVTRSQTDKGTLLRIRRPAPGGIQDTAELPEVA